MLLLLEDKAQHKLNLPWQSGSRVRRGGVVVVEVEIVRGGDNPETAGNGQVRQDARRRHSSGAIVKTEGARIAELHVVENVEELDAKLNSPALGNFGLFHDREVNLPGIQGSDDAVSGIPKSRKEAGRGVNGRCLKSVRIDKGYTVSSAARQSQRNPWDKIGALIRLVVAVRKQESVIARKIHGHCQGMARMPQRHATHAPATDKLAGKPALVEMGLTRAERELVHRVCRDVMTDIENARPLVALQAIDVLGTRRFPAAYRAIIDGMGPGVAPLE